jgi:hypothetical protein
MQFIKALPEIVFTNYGFFCFPFACLLIIFINWRKAEIRVRRKSILTIFWGLCLCFPIWGRLMNGMSYESNRWYYILTFLVCYSLPEWIDCIKKQHALSPGKIIFISAAILVVFSTRNIRTISYNALTFGSMQYNACDIIPVLFGITAIVAIYLWQISGKQIAIGSAVLFMLCANTWYSNANSIQGLFISEKDLNNTAIILGDDISEGTQRLLRPQEDEFFRVDNGDTKDTYLTANQSDIYLDYSTAAYNSLINKNLHKWLKRDLNLEKT